MGIETTEFHKSLMSQPLESVVQSFLMDGIPYCFKEKPRLYEELRLQVCRRLDVHPQNFTVVGSAKTGFSVAPEKYGKTFGDASDIDVVIVSEEIFQKTWLELIEFERNLLPKLDPSLKPRFKEMKLILFWGQLRFDKLSDDFTFAKKWWTLFNELSTDQKFGRRQIRGALFKSWRHATNYYESSLLELKRKYESPSI